MTGNIISDRTPTPPCPSRGGKARRRARRAIAVATAVAMAATHVPAMPARAQEKDAAQALPLIRDAEIEQLLRDYTRPVLRVAGLGQRNIRIVIINDRTFNPFLLHPTPISITPRSTLLSAP